MGLVAALATAVIWVLGDFGGQVLQLPLQLGACSICLGGVFLSVLLLKPAWWRGYLSRFSAEGGLGKLVKVLLSFIDAMVETAQLGKKAYAKALFWSVVGHSAALFGIVLSLYGMFHHYEFWGIAFTYLSTTSAGALAFLIPGSQLPWDAFFAGTLCSTASVELGRGSISSCALENGAIGNDAFGSRDNLDSYEEGAFIRGSTLER